MSVTICEFLESVCGPDDGTYIRVCSIDPETGKTKNQLCLTIDLAIKAAEREKKHSNVYFAPTRFNRAGFKRENAKSTKCFRVDLDDVDFPGSKQEEKRKSLLDALHAFPLKPTFEITTGGGVHAYWCTNEVMSEQDLTFVEKVNYGLAKRIGGDHCWDLPRLLRFPGTINYPNANKRAKGRSEAEVLLPQEIGPTYDSMAFMSHAENTPAVSQEGPKLGELPDVSEKLLRLVSVDVWLSERFGGHTYAEKEDGSVDRSRNDYAVAQKLKECGFTAGETAAALLQFEYGKAASSRGEYLSSLIGKVYPPKVERAVFGGAPDVTPVLDAMGGVYNEYIDPFLACLSVVAALAFSDLPCCLTLILIGPPSCGKSTVLNLFNDMELDEYFLRNDKCTTASWVSMYDVGKKKNSKEVDLLSKAPGHIMVTKELSAIFKDKMDELRKWFGVVASVLDGRGFVSHAGTVGKKEYKGDTTFNWLGASVHPEPYFHSIMSNTGTRILFYGFGTVDHTWEERVARGQLWNQNSRQEGKAILSALKIWVKEFFRANPVGTLQSGAISVPYDIAYKIEGYADFLSRVRQSYEIRDDYGEEKRIYSAKEDPKRVAEQLKALIRARAMVFGRDSVGEEDLAFVKNIVTNTTFEHRAVIVSKLLRKGGILEPKDILRYCANQRNARQKLEEMVGVGVCDQYEILDNGQEHKYFLLKPDYSKLFGVNPAPPEGSHIVQNM